MPSTGEGGANFFFGAVHYFRCKGVHGRLHHTVRLGRVDFSFESQTQKLSGPVTFR